MSDQFPARQNEGMSSGTLASWIGGALALFGGLNALGVGYVGTAVALLLGACVAFPPIYRAIARTGLALPGWMRTGLFVVAAFAAGAMLPELPNIAAPQPKQSPAPQAAQPMSPGKDAPGRPAPSAPARPVPVALLDIEGPGARTTRPFTTAGHNWDIHWKYDCANIGADGSLVIQVMRGDGSYTELNMTETGSDNEDTEYLHRGGTFYLIVNSVCNWHITVTDAPD